MRISRALSVALALAIPLQAHSQGLWFDIGDGLPDFVPCRTDGVGWLYFPPYPFGPYYPPGTLVYGDLVKTDCLPKLGCGPPVVAGYYTEFNDAGCGCGGFLVETCRLKVHYDDATVQSMGAQESELVLLHFESDGYQPLRNLVRDPVGNFLEGDVTGVIISDQYYAIATGPPTPVERKSWGQIKALWR